MLDDPGLSRQWVLRRLQKQLTTDRALHALEAGIARTAHPRARPMLHELATTTAARAEHLRRLVEAEGGAPYSSIGMARAASRLAGLALGLAGAWAWRALVVRLTTQAYAELDALTALARGAPGVSPDLAAALEPRLAGARADLERLRDP